MRAGVKRYITQAHFKLEYYRRTEKFQEKVIDFPLHSDSLRIKYAENIKTIHIIRDAETEEIIKDFFVTGAHKKLIKIGRHDFPSDMMDEIAPAVNSETEF